mgnify:CR=1 FL=1
MAKRKWHRLIRKSHRYLGVIFGIQFLFWTVSGFYFSWTNIKTIRGETIHKEEPSLRGEDYMVPVATILQQLKRTDTVHHLKTIQPVQVLNKAYYQFTFHNGKRMKTVLADAQTGIFRGPLTKEEALAVAKNRLIQTAEVVSINYITQTNEHHEYREKPLPAWAITFKEPVNSTVYVASELGTIQSYRNSSWRIFDFLWMMHIMDYKERDNINNWVLRIFTALGLITLMSGFALYMVSYRSGSRKPN